MMLGFNGVYKPMDSVNSSNKMGTKNTGNLGVEFGCESSISYCIFETEVLPGYVMGPSDGIFYVLYIGA